MTDRTEELKEQIKAEQAKIDAIKAEHPETKSEETKETVTTDQTYTEVEQEQMKVGWKPDGKLSAEEYKERGSFFRKIESQNKKIDELKDLMRQSVEHNQKLEKASYERAKRELINSKLQAVQDGDITKFHHIEKQVELVEQQLKEAEKVVVPNNEPDAPSVSEDIKAFQERHKDWLTGTSVEDKRMQRLVAGMVAEFQRTNPGINEKVAITEIETELKNVFPGKFSNPEQEKPALTMRSTVSKSTSKSLADKLTPQQQNYIKVARSLGCKLSNEDYAKQLQITGDLKDE